jgi:Icc-related predicted phosphoesterase
MKIIATSDLHQWIPKWKDFIKVCVDSKADIAIISGDLLPKEGFGEQMNFLAHMKKYALKIKKTGCQVVLTLGNDDNQNTQDFMEEEDKNGTWHYIHDKVKEINGYEFVGMSFVRDHPFGYKYWCRNEFAGQTFIDSLQFCEPLILDDKHKTLWLKNYKEFLDGFPSIQEYLDKLASQVKNISKSIWLIHNPPFRSGLDMTSRGQEVGSVAVLDFIEKHQPLMTVHGHIHESPHMTGQWKKKIGKTMAFQTGQIEQILHYAEIDIENGEIQMSRHPLYN